MHDNPPAALIQSKLKPPELKQDEDSGSRPELIPDPLPAVKEAYDCNDTLQDILLSCVGHIKPRCIKVTYSTAKEEWHNTDTFIYCCACTEDRIWSVCVVTEDANTKINNIYFVFLQLRNKNVNLSQVLGLKPLTAQQSVCGQLIGAWLTALCADSRHKILLNFLVFFKLC